MSESMIENVVEWITGDKTATVTLSQKNISLKLKS